ncbi:phospho-2-dehydro-3-deoxyheptonate aldolase [Actinorhabdospora filicis]|uniref:Phospho-2-dehydro-3-deoxyheptonate aldolase n=1 Tax=Actinorhabdospora filicis TaxID=1785913 RepID=A0A9W6SSX1_9ACTN|nr:3-deoxy-7-phosphoheptulonate synthase [Actinorhabdospora filicis]GLZ81732.1 phospho-2-dehydro-3-deoxyheptonate aldolase [Actinorhabdospora filicis]
MNAVLPSPEELQKSIPVTAALAESVAGHRAAIAAVLDGLDDRLLVIAGPCSVHDAASTLDYARRLRALAAEHRADLLIVLRAYLEKPRTGIGWPGLLLDPGLDDWCCGPAERALRPVADARTGLPMGRRLLAELAELDLPLAYEFVEPALAPYVADLVSWGAIGARTVESPPHRRLASALPMPIGCKNRPDGHVGAAVDAVGVATGGHSVVVPDGKGRLAVSRTGGNPYAHVVLRGGSHGPNYGPHAVADALDRLTAAGLPARVVVDASHGNSGKDHTRQPLVVESLAAQIAAGRTGLAGVMLESFIHPGNQPITPDLAYGISVTDGCMGLDTTAGTLGALATAVRARREARVAVPT